MNSKKVNEEIWSKITKATVSELHLETLSRGKGFTVLFDAPETLIVSSDKQHKKPSAISIPRKISKKEFQDSLENGFLSEHSRNISYIKAIYEYFK
jgi:hypothetical protein